MSTNECKNCSMPLGKDGGCHNPYCCDPEEIKNGAKLKLENTVDDLAMLVKRLAYQLRKATPDNDITDKAIDYLKRNNLHGKKIRDV